MSCVIRVEGHFSGRLIYGNDGLAWRLGQNIVAIATEGISIVRGTRPTGLVFGNFLIQR